jgi:hypothetical protein
MQPSLPDKIIATADSIEQISSEKTREELISLINDLINTDFHSLIQLLYRIDVNEKKIRFFLEENLHKDSADVITDLIIERQLQKIESRKKFSQRNNAEDGEEKW